MIKNDREQTLKKLMLASINGDKDAYMSLLNEISIVSKAYLQKRCSHLGQDRIEDLVQEVLLAVHQKRSSYRLDLPVLPWIFTITKHKLIDEVRAENRRRILHQKSEINEEGEHLSTLEDAEELGLILQGLTEKQKDILFLAKVEDVPLNEIAEKFKMSLSAVKVTIHRAIKSVRR